MAEVIVNYDPDLEFPKKKSSLTLENKDFKRLRLDPGSNYIDESILKAFSNHSAFEGRVKKGSIKVLGESKKPVADVGLSEMTVDEGLQMIGLSNSAEELEKWLKIESGRGGNNRKTLVNAITKRIEAVKAGNA